MTESSDKPEKNASVSAPTAPSNSDRPAQDQQQQRVQVQVDDSRAVMAYANFFSVTGTAEEVIMDFGMNPLPPGAPNRPIQIHQRIITGFYNAKRLVQALQLAVQRHEAAFGVLETDVQKRVRPGGVAQPPNQPPQPPANP